MNPPNRKRLPASPKEWLRHALSDLKLAKLGRKHQDVLYQQICFHTQQAVEKALKAVLLFRKINFPLTHDIQELIDIFEKAGVSLPSSFLDAGNLTPYAVETRYPGYWGEITEFDVDEAIKTAKMVVAWAEKSIKKNK